ncbi:MAG TPA: hypothetical protein VIM62_13680 [Acidobacteriaceae bacterium]
MLSSLEPSRLKKMKYEIRMPEAFGRRHPRRRLVMRDALALGVLLAITLALFAITGLYYGAYTRYRAALGLPTDNTPVITLPVVRRR